MWWVYFTLMQNQRFLLPYRDQYITRSWKSGVGHAGHDGQLEGMVNSFLTWHYTITAEHTEKNTEELNWNVDERDNLQACLQAPPLRWTRYLSFSVGRITGVLQFFGRIKSSHFGNLRSKHSGFISLHLQEQSWCFFQNHIKLLVQIPVWPCAVRHWSSFHWLELTGSVSLLVKGSECNPVPSGWHCLL